jgi:arylsulfatase A-like enzyme/Flp pilus assembly protein TadD
VRAGVIVWSRSSLAVSILCAALSAGACGPSGGGSAAFEAPPPASARGFNLLLITLDTTRADRLGSYGYERAATPSLDDLARRGVRVGDAVTVAPLTLPAHASLFTGVIPPRHGVRTNGHALADSHRTLAEILGEAGYQTAAFVSSFVLESRFNLDQGFEVYDDRVMPSFDATFGTGNERPAGAVTTAATAWLRARDVGRPFFAWVHYFDPHHGYHPPAEFGLKFGDRPYDGEIAYMDAEIGRLVGGLGEQGLSERTVIVVAGDHGESLGEHGERFHGRTVYEPAIRVPLIVAAPSTVIARPGIIDDRVVSLVDILPTLLEVMGIAAPGELDGLDMFRTHVDPDRAVYAEAVSSFLDSGWSPLYALRTQSAKYIEAPRPEQYELSSDPGERENQFRDGRANPLSDRLSGLKRKWPSIDITKRPSTPVDQETRSRLAALGYASGSDPSRPDVLPDPKDMLPVYDRMLEADAMMRAGRHAEAIQVLGEAVRLNPTGREVLHRLGEAYALANRPEDAERTLRRCLALGPSSPAATLLAQVLTKQKRFDDARKILDQVVGAEPDFGAAYVARGDVSAFEGRFEDAMRQYELAVKVDPYRSAGVVRERMAEVAARIRAPASRSSGASRPRAGPP